MIQSTIKSICIADRTHDRNLSVNNIIKSRNGTINSNVRWHATKPIPAKIKKVGSGAEKNIGSSWHPQLADKGVSIKNKKKNRSKAHFKIYHDVNYLKHAQT